MGEIRRSDTKYEYLKTIAHEFGHILGVDDAYPDPKRNRPAATGVTIDRDIMWDQFQDGAYISDITVAMAIVSQIEDKPQYFVEYNENVQSIAIKLMGVQ